MKALSIRQPWASLIIHGFKDIENRPWRTKFRGKFLIHAALKQDMEMKRNLDLYLHGIGEPGSFLNPENRRIQEMADAWPDIALKMCVGGIVGEAEIVDCVTESSSPWFQGKFGFVLKNARPLPFQPCKGRLGFFTPDLEARGA